jgi:hypothetical protein
MKISLKNLFLFGKVEASLDLQTVEKYVRDISWVSFALCKMGQINKYLSLIIMLPMIN